MSAHAFIFTPGLWQGQGEIAFTMADDRLPFTTRWNVSPIKRGVISLSQIVQVKSFPEPLQNRFSLSEITDTAFSITLENELIGKVEGRGVIKSQLIAWEFRDREQGFEGFEIYELQDNGSYKMKAEFLGGENYRTLVMGSIVKRQ